MTKAVAKAPGKLFLAGEYAVVEGSPAIVLAVDRYLTVEVSLADKGTLVSSHQPDLRISWERQEQEQGLIFEPDHPYGLVAAAMEMAETYLKDLGHEVTSHYQLKIESDLDDLASGRKYGLGSSGAVTVAAIKAILTYFGLSPDPLLVYKLAVLTQVDHGLSGSFGDLAASSFGGLLAYSRPNQTWLLQAMAEQSISQLVEEDWPGLHIEGLDLPPGLDILVGWTQTVASTEALLGQVKENVDQKSLKAEFVAASQICLVDLIRAFKKADVSAIKEGLRHNRQLLLAYTSQLGIVLETPSLKSLIGLAENFGAVAKTSGAGGGDCGFCLVENPDQVDRIHQAWQEAGVIPLDLKPAPPIT